MTCSFPLGLKPSVRSTVTVHNKLLMKVVNSSVWRRKRWCRGMKWEGEDKQSWVGMVFYYNLVFILFIYKFINIFISDKE